MLLLSIIVYQWTPKVLSLLLRETNLIYTSLLTLSVSLSGQYLINQPMLKQQLRHFNNTGVSNMVLPYILSLIVDQKTRTPVWHTFVHFWVLDTILEHLTLLGLMDSLKIKTKTMVHISVCFYKTLPRIEHQVHMYAFAHNSQPFSALNVSPHKFSFIYDLKLF